MKEHDSHNSDRDFLQAPRASSRLCASLTQCPLSRVPFRACLVIQNLLPQISPLAQCDLAVDCLPTCAPQLVARVAVQVRVVSIKPIRSLVVAWLVATTAAVAIGLTHALPVRIVVIAGRVAIVSGVCVAPTASSTLGFMASGDAVRQVEASPRWAHARAEIICRRYLVAIACVLLVAQFAFRLFLVLSGLLPKLALSNAVLYPSPLLGVLDLRPVRIFAAGLGLLGRGRRVVVLLGTSRVAPGATRVASRTSSRHCVLRFYAEWT
jgi:hypothetical protein